MNSIYKEISDLRTKIKCERDKILYNSLIYYLQNYEDLMKVRTDMKEFRTISELLHNDLPNELKPLYEDDRLKVLDLYNRYKNGNNLQS